MTAVLRCCAGFVLAIALLLGGCATATMTLSKEELRTIRIDRVDVVYAPEAEIYWDKVEYAYVDSVKATRKAEKPWKQVANDDKTALDEHSKIAKSPEGQAHIRGKLTDEIKRRLGTEIAPNFQGTRGVVLEVQVVHFSVPSAAQRIVLGGSPILGAITVLKDAKTGQELAKMDRLAGGYAGNGVLGVLVDQAFDDMEDRVFATYIKQLRGWMDTKREV